MLNQLIGYIQAVGRRLGKGTGKSRPIANGENTGTPADLEFLAAWPGGIILALNAIKQGVIIGRTRRNVIQRVEGFDNIVQLAFGQAGDGLHLSGVRFPNPPGAEPKHCRR